jgi:ABC-type transport system involved in cytochrome c biogenesis permease component
VKNPFRSWERSTHPVARRQRLEVLMGFTGFFALVAFGSAVAAELRGGAALVEVLVLLFFLALLGLTYRSWRHTQL